MKTLIVSSLFSLSILIYTPLGFAGDPFVGSNIYVKYCAECHGGDGRGVIAGTPSFRDGALMRRSYSDLVTVTREGKNLMPAYRGLLDEQQIDDVITYIRTFN